MTAIDGDRFKFLQDENFSNNRLKFLKILKTRFEKPCSDIFKAVIYFSYTVFFAVMAPIWSDANSK